MNKIHFYIIATALCFSTILFLSCGNSKNYTTKNTASVIDYAHNIDYFSENDSLDFSFLNDHIGNKSIIILGEVGHGDGRSFEVKTKIIKHLMKEKGFNTIALEGGGFLDFAAFNRWIEVPEKLHLYSDSLTSSWNQLWSKASETKALQELIYDNKIAAIGIENQGTTFGFFLPQLLKNYFEDRDLNTEEINWKRINEVNKIIMSYDTETQIEKTDFAYSVNTFEEIKVKLINLSPALKSKNQVSQREVFFHSIDNLLSFYRQYQLDWNTYEGQNEGINVRDKQMANNLLWYKKLNPAAKIIVWTANFHAARNIQKVRYKKDEPHLYDSFKLFGDYIFEKTDGNIYSLGFSSAEGTTGYAVNMNKTDTIQVANHDLEKSLSKFNYAFVPFKSIREEQPTLKEAKLHSSMLGYNSKPGQWLQLFDGLMFIKENKRATLLKEE